MKNEGKISILDMLSDEDNKDNITLMDDKGSPYEEDELKSLDIFEKYYDLLETEWRKKK